MSLTLTRIQATHMPPRHQMNEIKVAAGRPLLWMMRDVAAQQGAHRRHRGVHVGSSQPGVRRDALCVCVQRWPG